MLTRLVGKGSTYGNYPGRYRDPADNNRPALQGASNNRPGIAVYQRSTLGGYWRVRSPNGKTAIVQQTDIGPAPWTHMKVDINAKAAHDVFGLPLGNSFPTGQGAWRATYLGKGKPRAQAAPRPARAVEAPIPAQQGSGSLEGLVAALTPARQATTTTLSDPFFSTRKKMFRA